MNVSAQTHGFWSTDANSEVLQFSRGARGNMIVSYRGYGFHMHRKYKGKVSWQCNQRKRFKCRVNLHTFNNRIYKQSGQHNHLPVVSYY